MPGVFKLQTPEDLFAKLGRELERLKADPGNDDVFFNFVVTAEHLVDWLDTEDSPAGRNRRKAERKKPLLQAVSHIANSAKHFDDLRPSHVAIANPNAEMRHIRASDGGSDKPATWYMSGAVEFTDAVKNDLGFEVTSPLNFAERVYKYWERDPRLT